MKRLAASFLQLESTTVTLSPTVLVHEAYVKLAKQVSDKYQSRGSFLEIAATMMRRILVDHARARHRIKRGENGYLLSGKVPILEVTHDSLITMLSLGRFSELCTDPKFTDFVRLLAQCISPDANDRPHSMSEVGTRLAGLSSRFPWSGIKRKNGGQKTSKT